MEKELLENIKTKKLHVENWCEGCGECILHCHQNALSVKDGKVVVDHSKCLCCGYCSSYCKLFALKVI